jgi:hypothetical protein
MFEFHYQRELVKQIRLPEEIKSELLDCSRPVTELKSQPTPWSRVILEKLIVTQLVKKFPAFYGT